MFCLAHRGLLMSYARLRVLGKMCCWLDDMVRYAKGVLVGPLFMQGIFADFFSLRLHIRQEAFQYRKRLIDVAAAFVYTDFRNLTGGTTYWSKSRTGILYSS